MCTNIIGASMVSSGCTLGNPSSSEHVTIPDVSQLDVIARDNKTSTAQKLALNLLALFFKKEQLVNGLCSLRKNSLLMVYAHLDVLDQRIIEGIRCKQTYTITAIPHMQLPQYMSTSSIQQAPIWRTRSAGKKS